MTSVDAPADTRMMGVVHAALQRDLLRVRGVLDGAPRPVGGQRRAIADHVVWMMSFLHAHHTSEDAGLWPLVRQRDPDAIGLLDSLEADHRAISPAAEGLTAAAVRYGASVSDEQRIELVRALDTLTAVLFPHLDREVAEAMPVVSACVSRGEWRAIEHRFNIGPKSLPQLAMEAHWLLDGIDAEGQRVVTQTVPAMARLLVTHGFRAAYRRQARARWESDPGDGR